MTQQTMSEKDQFVTAWEQEHATTMRTLREYPAGKEDFRPAAKSRTGRELVWIFLAEEKVIEGAITGNLPFGAPPPPPPVTIAELTRMYETGHRELVAKVQAMPESRLGATMKFPVGPGQMGDARVGQVFWMMLMDHIHHRGQLSVYLRILGARVPSIYGPTADEPWS
jgi:uncharacterized damage-inducible protein DinB